MFRKHTLMAVILLAAAALHAPLAGAEERIPTQQDAIPTCGTIFTLTSRTNATSGVISATNQVLFATSDAILTENSFRNPTMFPQRAALSASSRGQIPSTGHDYTTQSAWMQEQMMMNLLNQDRKNNGLPALAHDEELTRIARIKSADMRDEGYFAHESPTYGNIRAMLKHFGYPYAGASENIAHHANADKAQAAFMSSPGHRANILSKVWTKVGIGIVFDPQGYIYATQIFAR